MNEAKHLIEASSEMLETLRLLRPILAFEAGRYARRPDREKPGIWDWERMHKSVVAVIEKASGYTDTDTEIN